MKHANKTRLVSIFVTLFVALMALSGCTHLTRPFKAVDETRILVDFFEKERNYVHDGRPFVMSAQALRTNLLTKPDRQYLIDVRPPASFARGHIKGAVNMSFQDVYEHVKKIPTKSYENIVLISATGQDTAYAVSLLRAAGYPNTASLKWGMSSWNQVFALEAWLRNISNNRANELVTTPSPPKNPPGTLPILKTGKTTPQEILEARLQKLFKDGCDAIMLKQCCLFKDCFCEGDFYIVNYWEPDLYLKQGHIPGAVNYPPSEKPFNSKTYLTTLPATKVNALYCFTGQTSSFVAGYLRILGYNARSVLFGANGMIYDKMRTDRIANTFLPETEILNYDYESGN